MSAPAAPASNNNKPQRPSSAPNPRVRLRQYNQLVQQLTNTVAETKRPPPAGADIEAIAARRTKLERVLRDVQESIQATKTEQKEHQDGRYKKAVIDQVTKEQQYAEELKDQEERSRDNSKMYWNRTMGMRRRFNERTDKRTQDAFTHLDNAHADRVKKNYDTAVKRQTKLTEMEEKHAQIRMASKQRRQEIREHTEMLYQRKLEGDAAHQKQQDDLALARKEDYERRQKILDEKKMQRSASATTHRDKAKKKGTFDFEKAMENATQRQKDQHLRFQHEERIRAAERMRKKQLQTLKEEQREKRFLETLQMHLDNGSQIKKKIAYQNDYVESQKQDTADRMLRSSQNRNQEIASHQHKAKQRWDAKIDAGFQGNYNRWTRRADHVMTKIIGSYDALNTQDHPTADGTKPEALTKTEGHDENGAGASATLGTLVAEQPHRATSASNPHRGFASSTRGGTVNIVTPQSNNHSRVRRGLPPSGGRNMRVVG